MRTAILLKVVLFKTDVYKQHIALVRIAPVNLLLNNQVYYDSMPTVLKGNYKP